MLRSQRRGHARPFGLASLVGLVILVLATPAVARERPINARTEVMCATVPPGATSADVNGASVTFTWTDDGVSWAATDADARHFRVTVRLADGNRVAVWGLTGSWFGDATIDSLRPCHCPPPAEEPPADEPPADEPPADEPPADEPPAEEPPAEEPPAEEPPAEEPPAEAPPAEEPPTDETPSDVGAGAIDTPVSAEPLPETEVLAVKIVNPVAAPTVLVAQETLPVTGIGNTGLAALGFSLVVAGLLMLRYARHARPRGF